MNNDFSWEEIADWIEGRLSKQEAETLETSLRNADRTVQAEVEWLRAFYNLSASIPLKNLSGSARQKLTGQYKQWLASQRTTPNAFTDLSNAFRVLVATLASDSWQTPLVGVRRGDEQRESRQLIYKTEFAELALNIRPQPKEGKMNIRGQLFIDDAALNLQTISAQLVQNRSVREIALNDLGEFGFDQVVPGYYNLILSNKNIEIVVPALSLEM